MAFARPRPEVVHSSFSGLWESQLETALSVGIWRDHPGAAPTGDCTHCSAPLSHRGSEVHQGAQQGRPRSAPEGGDLGTQGVCTGPTVSQFSAQ